MPEIAFVKPNYPDERRVALLPQDAHQLIDSGFHIIVEKDFGEYLGIDDRSYADQGVEIRDRAGCYGERYIFNLKLTQPSDYPFLRSDHVIVGWTHPFGSGKSFYEDVAAPKGITLVDIDSVMPRIFCGTAPGQDADFFPPHMFWKNSYNAGIASVQLAGRHFKLDSDVRLSICVLGSGSVAQGAFHELSRLGFQPRMFYRKTLPLFRDQIASFDIIVNGIEVDTPNSYIIDRDMLGNSKPDVLIIDAAADAGNAIWGTDFQSINAPVGITVGRKYVLVNNVPTIMTEQASTDISNVVACDVLPALFQNLDRLVK